MKIGIFTGGTSVRSKNIFNAISRYPTGKHEINRGSTARHTMTFGYLKSVQKATITVQQNTAPRPGGSVVSVSES